MNDVCCVTANILLSGRDKSIAAMTMNTLCAAFRKIAVGRISTAATARYSTQRSNRDANIGSRLTSDTCGMQCGTGTIHSIKFIPGTLNIDIRMPANGSLIRNIIESPAIKIPPLREPVKRLPIQYDSPVPEKSVDLPTSGRIIDKQAENMLRIRHKKMKKHKRKKLRKKMKFVWAKIRLKRAHKRERLFQAELRAKVKEAQAFDPKEYVNEKLNILNKERLPRMFRGEILPPEMIKQFVNEKKARKDAKRNKPRLTL
ncbi:uncharacterized protein LOC112456484 [Temnothorax curvispinosus]|uniref:Uncharacterized protein LOC112456484 n=1 Tax=Temnothorax curvispinosus TaxID=300111 RepID=A0A6J1PYA0_9HYME|nr:uncharacterized protein LOC112456484 [Temnothorax curvispinosus]